MLAGLVQRALRPAMTVALARAADHHGVARLVIRDHPPGRRRRGHRPHRARAGELDGIDPSGAAAVLAILEVRRDRVMAVDPDMPRTRWPGSIAFGLYSAAAEPSTWRQFTGHPQPRQRRVWPSSAPICRSRNGIQPARDGAVALPFRVDADCRPVRRSRRVASRRGGDGLQRPGRLYRQPGRASGRGYPVRRGAPGQARSGHYSGNSGHPAAHAPRAAHPRRGNRCGQARGRLEVDAREGQHLAQCRRGTGIARKSVIVSTPVLD